MPNIFEVKQLETELINWMEDANKQLDQFERIYTVNEIMINRLNLKIVKSFTYVFYKRIPQHEREMLLEAVRNQELSAAIAKSFDEADSLPKYGPMNALVALRIYHRKITALIRNTYAAKEKVWELFEQLKEIDMRVREIAATGHKSDSLFNIQMNILAYQPNIKEFLELKFNQDPVDYMVYIQVLLGSGNTIKRDDLLQVITLNKDLRYWDGSPVEPFSKIYSEIPEEIDWNEFQNLIFVENIENPDDDYLADLFTDHIFMVRDQYEAETGQKAFDAFEILEDITGKPLQTYTAEFDEYGDVVNLTPNKPILKVVEGGHE